MRALPEEAWDEESARRVGQGADAHHEELRLPLLGVAAARADPSARLRLVEQARGGSLDALAALGDVRVLSADVVTNLITGITERVDQQVRDALGGSVGFGGHDVGHALALLNVWHPDLANWDPLFNLLEEKAVVGGDKRGALQVLASRADHLREDVRPRLEAVAVAVAGQPPSAQPAFFAVERDAAGAATELAAALGVLDDDATAQQLLALLAGDLDHRLWAARVARRLSRPEDTGVLVTLTQDPEPDVRAAAAAGIAFLVAAGRGGAVAVSSLQRCLRDPGTRVPANIAVTLANAPDRGVAAQDALSGLRSYTSAQVRAIALSAAGS